MKQILKYLTVCLAMVSFFAACSKVDPLPHYNNGNAVSLTSSTTTVVPTQADSTNAVVTFNWTNPNYATDSSNYKFVLEIDSAGGDYMRATKKEIMAGYTTSITGRELNNILLNYGYTVGQPYNLKVRIASSYGNNNERYYSNEISLSVSAFNDPSVLTNSDNNVVLSLPTANDPVETFDWTASFTGYSGTVTYTIQYDIAGGGFGTVNEIPVGDNIYTKTLTQDQMNQTAINSGIVMGAQGSVEYRIKAVTALGAIAYSNAVTIQIQSYVSILRFYMPGGYQSSTGNGNDWDPSSAPELIRDQRSGLLNNMYYIYIYLPANAEFKFTQGQSWSINYGSGGAGVLSPGGGNLSVGAAGWYRITINVGTMEYNITQGRMGFVGGATGAGWNPPNVFPTYAMANAGTNLFIGVTDFTVDGWKMIDNDAWNNGSNAVDETRSYGSSGPSGSTVEINGGNFSNPPSSGAYRAIWDGRNRDNVTYQFMGASEMRLVGDGINGVNAWDPAASPQMTYSGNGVWTITVDLLANKDIKFLAGNAWGAFDYEDNSGQSQSVGSPRGIKWEGGDNFKTPAVAGTYTITLNENTQSMRID